jgi:hypothetical protein
LLDLLHHVAQVIGPLQNVVPPRYQIALLLTQPCSRVKRRFHSRSLVTSLAEGIQDVPLRRGPEERLRLVLAVQVHHHPAQGR